MSNSQRKSSRNHKNLVGNLFFTIETSFVGKLSRKFPSIAQHNHTNKTHHSVRHSTQYRPFKYTTKRQQNYNSTRILRFVHKALDLFINSESGPSRSLARSSGPTRSVLSHFPVTQPRARFPYRRHDRAVAVYVSVSLPVSSVRALPAVHADEGGNRAHTGATRVGTGQRDGAQQEPHRGAGKSGSGFPERISSRPAYSINCDMFI